MRDWQSPSPVRWYGQYPLVFVPKDRRRVLYGQRRSSIGRMIRARCQPQGVALVEGHARPAHVPWCRSMPPKDSVAKTVGGRKGKAAMRMQRAFLGRARHCTGWHFCARGYCVSTVGLEEQVVREDIRHQEQEEKRQEELQLKGL